ncbi:MAG: response regulator [Hyphomicrobiales bacterium]
MGRRPGDYELPQLDGHDAIYIVREHLTLDTPFIFISKGVDAETAITLMQAGAQDYVLKSNLGRLPVAVSREMDAAHTRREKRLAHDKIEEQDRLLRQLLASAPDAICFKDLQLRYLGLNQAE